LENRHECVEEHLDHLRAGRTALDPAPTSNTFRRINPMGRTTCYLVVTLDTRFTWSPHIDQVRKKAAQRMDMLDHLLKRRSDLSNKNEVLLYKQLIRLMMDYA
jgi:hypothetical protein